jgi:hypothetical protein
MQDAGYKIHDADPVCGFSGGQARSSVLGVRSSALIGPGSWVPGIRNLEPGTGYLSSKNAHTGYAGCRIGRVGE